MSRSRMVVAFEEVESPQDRMFRQLATGKWEDDIPVRRVGKGRYWCAADKPRTDETFVVAPVHRTTEVPSDAVCQECGIGIAELQAMMS